jgi:hypothetical protein
MKVSSKGPSRVENRKNRAKGQWLGKKENDSLEAESGGGW